jgi:DNA-binding response OmpR family regulator
VHKRVLLIDDDPDLLDMLKLGLESGNLIAITAHDGREGIQQAYKHHPNVIILDLAMGGMDGFTACQRLRDVCDTPIMILSGRTDRRDIVKGLSLGADGYVTKPCSLNELRARVHALLRRSEREHGRDADLIYDDGTLQIDFRTEMVRPRGETVRLSPIETRLLLCLAGKRGQIVLREELLARVWGAEYGAAASPLSV